MNAATDGGSVEPAPAHFVELTPNALQVIRVDSGAVCFSRNAALDNKAILELLLNEASAGWQENGWTASLATFLPATSWHLVGDDKVRALGANATLGALAGTLPHGLSGDTMCTACSAGKGAPIDTAGESRWVVAIAPAEGLSKLQTLAERCNLRSNTTGPAVLDHVGAISRLLRATGQESVALWELALERSHVFLVTGNGIEAVVPCEVKLTDVWETIRAELNLKYQLAAARLFYGDLFDFTDAAPRIASQLAPALSNAFAALPGKGAKPTLACAGLTPTQNWLATHLAAAMGTTSWQLDPETALSELGLHVGGDLLPSQLAPATFGLLHRASVSQKGGRAWQPVWTPTGTAATIFALAAPKPAPVPAPAAAPAPAPEPPKPAAPVAKAPIPAPVPAAVPRPAPAPVPTPVPAAKAPEAPKPVAPAAPAPKPAPAPLPAAKAPAPIPRPAQPVPAPAPKPAQPAPVVKAPEPPKPAPAPAPAQPAPKPVAPAAPAAKAPIPAPQPAPATKPAPTPAPAAKAPEPAKPVETKPAPAAVKPTPKPAEQPKPAPAPAAAPAPAKKKTPMGLIIGVAALVLLGGVGYYLYDQNVKENARIVAQQKADEARKVDEARRAEEARKVEASRQEELAKARAETERLRKQAEASAAREADAAAARRAAEEALARAPGVLTLTSDPVGAEVVIDDKTPQLTPAIVTGVEPGMRRLVVRLPGYDAVEQTVQVKGAQTLDLGVITLQRQYGTLTLHTDPADAEYAIYTSDAASGTPLRTGRTPAQVDRLLPGDYVIKFTRSGLLPTTEHATIAGKATVDVGSTFTVGGASITSNPSGATVRMNGEVIGTTPLVRPELSPGNATFELNLPDHEPLRLNGEITNRETLRLHGELLHVDRIAKSSEIKTFPKPDKKNIAPTLPSDLKERAGEVKISVVVTRTGALRDIVVASSTNSALNDACVKAVQQWKFSPAIGFTNQTLNARLTIPFRFKITEVKPEDQ